MSSIDTTRILALLGAALLTGCAAETETTSAEDTAASTSQEIIQGQSASRFTEAALIDTTSYICSGAIIAPRVALTAGHCVSASRYTVKAPYANNQSARATRKWTTYQSTGSSVNPNSSDVAVLILDTPIQLATYPKLVASPVADGTNVTNVGRIRNGQASSSALFFGAPVPIEASTLFPYAYQSDVVIQSGDSGGPVYVGTGSNRKIVAVNSGASSSLQVLARVDFAYAKIRQIIDQNGGAGD